MPPKHPKLMIVAGEVSGDHHAALLVRALRERTTAIEVFGVGGAAMRAAGVDTVYGIEGMAVTGLTETLGALPRLRRLFRDLLALARRRRPDAVILVDYPGFNLRLAARLHALGWPTIYYICPQVWAWRRGRIPHMARIIDRLICFFPFEKTCFEGTGLHVAAVGHPLVDDIAAFRARPAPPLPWGGDCRVGLLPGSRDQEIRRLLPAMWQAARRIEARHPQAAFLIPTTDEAAAARIRARLARLGSGPRRWACVPGAARQVMAEAHAALIASGTATLEAALLDCPTVLTYRVSPLTYLIARMLVRVDYLGLVNLLAGCEVCPECLQYRATPSNLAATVEPLLSDPAARERMRLGMARVRDLLGGPGAAGRAADAVLAAMAPTPAAP